MTKSLSRVVIAGALIGASLVGSPAQANRFRDNPEHVVDRASAPWTSPIGELERDVIPAGHDGRHAETSTVGTGFLVSPCYIMTAAHSVYGDDLTPVRGKDYTLMFRAGISFTSAFAGRTEATPVVSGDRTILGGNDWAILKLKSCIGKRPEFGWLEAGLESHAVEKQGAFRFLRSKHVIALGYSATTQRGALSLGEGQILSASIHKELLTNASFLPGQSGGPALTLDEGSLKVIGILTAELGAVHGATYDHYSKDHANIVQDASVLTNSYIKDILNDDKAAFGHSNPAAERLRMDHLPQ